MNDTNIAIVISIISLVVIGLLVFVLVRKDKTYSSENFKKCICTEGEGGRERACQDTVTVNNLYVTGKLTENSDLKSPGWSKVSPGDVDFPVSNGCSWPNSVNQKENKWQEWDFTDFGN